MFAKSKSEKLSNNNVFLCFVKGLIISIILSLVCVLIFAFLLKWFNFNDSVIKTVTFGIKCLSVAVGTLVAVKGNSKGLIKGAIFGIIYICVAFLTFGILAGSMAVDISNLLDLLSCMLVGAIIGVIKVNKSN
ncbi:MAG: TIGR04086 family membrane protein [Clostridia bacterium]|nr:TIGR04086 family membrane protein [Clostridia bacterium]